LATFTAFEAHPFVFVSFHLNILASKIWCDSCLRAWQATLAARQAFAPQSAKTWEETLFQKKSQL
jgi:hypothetical protein